jgi:hypothetical protein
MSTTSILGIDYPTENENPFHVTHATGMEELDEWLRIMWEEASIFIVFTGDITLAGNVVSWTDTIRIVSGRSGAIISVAAGSVTLNDGNIASLTGVARPLVTGALATFTTGAGPSWTRTLLPLFYRRGSNVYLLRRRLGLEELTLLAP